jgi:TolA-binding protein
MAATTFYDNYQKRPKGDRAADSLAWLGEALIQLKKPADACKVYSQLDQDFGASLSASLRGMMEKGRARAKCGA